MPRVRTQRSGAEPGTSGRSSSPSPRSVAIRCGVGTPASSANDARIPRAASPAATSGSSRAGAWTIRPTSRWRVLTCFSGLTPRNLLATAVTSSVDIIHEPAAITSASWVTSAASRSRHLGIARTRRGVFSTTSTAAGSSAASVPACVAAGASEAKVARTCSRSSRVSLARRSSCSEAIARVFSRACPTGSP